jgi:hypothetical protein
MARHVAACAAAAGDGPESEWGEHPDRELISEEVAVQTLVASCAPGWDAEPSARALVAGRTLPELWSIVLRGDPYNFMRFPAAMELLTTALEGEIREADPGKMVKHHPEGKAALEALFTGLKRWCAAVSLPGDLPNLVTQMRRRVVVLTDTDSTFLNLDPWMAAVSEMYDLTEASENERLTVLNVMVYLLRLLSDTEMGWLMANLGVPEEKRGLINFKSEFVIPRMVLTAGKKNYAS